MAFYRPLFDVAKDYQVWATSDHPRTATGFPILDERTSGGAAAGEVILFTARSQVGKTAVACNVIENQPVDTAVVFFSLEMNGRYIAKRQAAIHAGVPTNQLEWELRMTGKAPALQQLVDDFPYLAIIDKPAMSLKEMAQAADECRQAWGKPTQLFVIDYLELIGGIPSIVTLDKIDTLCRKIKDFAREQDAVVLLLHQVGRGEGGPGADPLAIDSGRYGGETQADYVLAAYRPCLRHGITQDEYLEERWQIYLQFLKTRGGSEIHPQGELYCFHPETMRITKEWAQPPRSLFTDNHEEVPDLQEAF